MTLLAAHDLHYATAQGKELVRGISFDLRPGEIIGLVGANGAGKTSLLKLLTGLMPPSQGGVMLESAPLASYPPMQRARRIAYIAQHVAPAWPLSVEQTVALGRIPHGGAMHCLSAADAQAVEEAMHGCRVDYLRNRTVTTLSGGEQARVWLARALATQTNILLADEPTAGLDLHYQLLFLELLHAWRAPHRGAIVAIHDLSLAARFCDRLLVLSHGRVAGFDTAETLMRQNVLSRAFGVTLHALTVQGLPLITATARIEEPCA